MSYTPALLTSQGGVVTNMQAASYKGAAATVTGYLLIEMPGPITGANPMAMWTVRGFDYAAASGEWELNVGGYQYATTPAWVNTSSRASGLFPGGLTSVPVRFLVKGAANNGTYAIAIGDVGTSWSYPQITVEQRYGYSGQNFGLTQPVISFVTDISTWTVSVTETPIANPSLTGAGASGTWPIGISGNAATATTATSATNATNATNAGNADTTDGLHAGPASGGPGVNALVRSDGNGYTYLGYINSAPGYNENNASSPDRVWGSNSTDAFLRTYRTGNLNVNWGNYFSQYATNLSWAGQGRLNYIWQGNDQNWVYPVHTNYFARGIIYLNHQDVGTLAGNTAYGPWYWGHGLGTSPDMVVPTATYDDGTHSVGASIGNLWDATNVAVCGRNWNASTGEACAMGFIAYKYQ